MFFQHMRIAIRRLLKDKFHSGIHLLGLTTGMAACLLIWSYVSFEYSFDRFNQRADRIYRIATRSFQGGEQVDDGPVTGWGVGANMLKDFPETEAMVRIHPLYEGAVVTVKDDRQNASYREPSTFYVDGDLLRIFSFPLIKGDPAKVLTQPTDAVISRSTARRFFGDLDPIGKHIVVNSQDDYVVAGVAEDVPENSHFRFEILLANQRLMEGYKNYPFAVTNFFTYVLLREGVTQQAYTAKLPGFVDKYLKRTDADDNIKSEMYLQPLTDIHLQSNTYAELSPNNSYRSVLFLGLIAVLILAIAWINYINLATARSLNRAREVGIRKVVGAVRRQLQGQFMIETLVMNAFALMLAIMVGRAVMPWFARLTDTPLELHMTRDFLFGFAGLFLLGVLLSGVYPAFVLSSFKPYQVLKGKYSNTGAGLFLRKGLVTTQFAASFLLLAGAMTVFSQLHYMRNRDLGIRIDQNLVINSPFVSDYKAYPDQLQTLKNKLGQVPGISSFTAASNVPGSDFQWIGAGYRRQGHSEKEATTQSFITVDEKYFSQFDIQLIAGRPFNEQPQDQRNLVAINEASSKSLGFTTPEGAIGQVITDGDGPDATDFQVVAVVKNFNYQSLKENYVPMIFRFRPAPRGYYTLKVTPQNLDQTIASTQAAWEEVFPGQPFDYFFLDHFFNEQYKADRRFGQVFTLFTVMALLIAVLGLLGLVSFTVTQRTREVGIRKVLGATSMQVISLFTRDFVKLLILAFVVAAPLAYWGIQQWLQGFANRIALSPLLLILPAVVVTGIALITICSQALRAALSNPTQALRSE